MTDPDALLPDAPDCVVDAMEAYFKKIGMGSFFAFPGTFNYHDLYRAILKARPTPLSALELARTICNADTLGLAFHDDKAWPSLVILARAPLASRPQESAEALAAASAWCYDMEKAPRNGKKVDLLGQVGERRVRAPDCYWHKRKGTWISRHYDREGFSVLREPFVPVAWMLPAPPTQPGKEGQP